MIFEFSATFLLFGISYLNFGANILIFVAKISNSCLFKVNGEGGRVPGPYRDYARDCNHRGQSRTIMSAINMTTEIYFERLYLVLGLCKIALSVNCPYTPTTPTVYSTTVSRFPCNFFPRMTPHFFCHHDSPSNLAKSLYTRGGRGRVEFLLKNDSGYPKDTGVNKPW